MSILATALFVGGAAAVHWDSPLLAGAALGALAVLATHAITTAVRRSRKDTP